MGTGDWTTRASAAGAPVLFVVDADPQARAVTESALARRFGADYQVVTADAPQAGLDALARLAGRGDQVALLAADLHLPGMDGVEFLGRAHLAVTGRRSATFRSLERAKSWVVHEIETVWRLSGEAA